MEIQIASLEKSIEKLSYADESVPILSKYNENLSLWKESETELWNYFL